MSRAFLLSMTTSKTSEVMSKFDFAAAMAAAPVFEPWEGKTRKRRKRPADGLLMSAEAAERLGITVEQLSAFIRDGELRYVNVGRGAKRPRYRFTEADINELIEKRKEQGGIQCPSTKAKSPRRISGSTSGSVAVGFMARRAAQIAAKRKR